MAVGASEAETFWTDESMRSSPQPRAAWRGVKLVISDAHEGLKAAVTKILHATWQARTVPRIAHRMISSPNDGTPRAPPLSQTGRKVGALTRVSQLIVAVANGVKSS